MGYVGVDLALADSKYFRATGRAYALGCWSAVLHGDALWVLHFPLGAALHAISLHIQASSLVLALTLNYLTRPSQAGSYPFGNKKGVVPKTTPEMGEKGKGIPNQLDTFACNCVRRLS